MLLLLDGIDKALTSSPWGGGRREARAEARSSTAANELQNELQGFAAASATTINIWGACTTRARITGRLPRCWRRKSRRDRNKQQAKLRLLRLRCCRKYSQTPSVNTADGTCRFAKGSDRRQLEGGGTRAGDGARKRCWNWKKKMKSKPGSGAQRLRLRPATAQWVRAVSVSASLRPYLTTHVTHVNFSQRHT